MAEPRWTDVRRILEQALDLEGEARTRFLDEACGNDRALRAEVDSLLAAHASRAGWLAEPMADAEHGFLHRLGKFRLIRELGRGGMGAVVWLAHDEVFGRDVALKVVAEGVSTSPQEIERFQRESKSAGKLTHPGIVRVYEEGRTEHASYFAMQYVAGHDLARELELQAQLAPGESCILPPFASSRYLPTVVRVCEEIANALAYAHEQGVLHRDIKPRNLLLDRDGKPYLADFGLARDDRFGSISQSGAILGTPYYMSPEQARVAAAGTVDHRTDVYSLGVVLYELLTLQRPFEGQTGDEIRSRIQHDDPRNVQSVNRRVPADLATICHGAIAKDRADRYESAAALAEDLRRFLAHEAILYRPPPVWRRVTQRVRRHRGRLVVGALVVLVATGTWAFAAGRALAEERDARLQTVRQLLEESDWAKLPTERTLAVRASLRRLQADPATANDVVVARADARFRELRTAMLASAEQQLLAGRADSIDPGAPYVTEAKLVDGAFLLQRAAMIFEEPGLLARLGPNPFAPRLSVTARDANGERSGRVGYREIDGVTGVPGPLVDLGPLPLRDVPVVAGYLRIVVRVDGDGSREFSRLLWRGTWNNHVDVDVQRPLDEAEMASIAGDTLRLRDDRHRSRV